MSNKEAAELFRKRHPRAAKAIGCATLIFGLVFILLPVALLLAAGHFILKFW